MRRFVKKDIFLEVFIVVRLVKRVIIDNKIYVNYKKIDIGFLIERELKEVIGVSEK